MSSLFDDADFDVLRTDQAAEFTIHGLHIPRGNPKPVTLICKHWGEANKDLQAAHKNKAFRKLVSEDATRATIELLARYVIVGWRDVNDKDGSPREYSAKLGEELLRQLVRVENSVLIDRIALFVREPSNFRAPLVDAEELGKG